MATFVLTCTYTQTVEMLRTRLEIEALLKKAAGNLQKTQEIHRELQSLMNYIQTILDASSSAKRKSPKPSRSLRAPGRIPKPAREIPSPQEGEHRA